MGSARRVYAIVRDGTSLSSLDAGDGGELSLVPWRALAAVTGMASDEAAPATLASVLHHEQVVEAVRRRGPALPVRFGTVFRDAPSVASAVASRYDALAADLDRLGDKVELGLTALWADDTSDDASPLTPPDEGTPSARGAGARYLRDRAAQARRDDTRRERARAVAEELGRALGAFALERRVSLLPTPRIAVRATYLLEPTAVPAFKEAFEATRRTRSEVRALLTGPWPPYSFVRRADAAGETSPLESVVQGFTDVLR